VWYYYTRCIYYSGWFIPYE